MTQTNTTSLQPAVAASHEDAQQGSTSTFRDLITPELIARARDSFGMSFKKKYAEVIDSRYTVKLGPKISHYEYRVLQFLEKIPDVQTPRPFDFFSIEVTRVERDTREESSEIWHVIIMSTIPGKDFGSSARGLTRDQLREILEEALRFVDRIDSFIAAGAMFPISKATGIRSSDRPTQSQTSMADDASSYHFTPACLMDKYAPRISCPPCPRLLHNLLRTPIYWYQPSNSSLLRMRVI
jgi:hypothetical protein